MTSTAVDYSGTQHQTKTSTAQCPQQRATTSTALEQHIHSTMSTAMGHNIHSFGTKHPQHNVHSIQHWTTSSIAVDPNEATTTAIDHNIYWYVTQHKCSFICVDSTMTTRPLVNKVKIHLIVLSSRAKQHTQGLCERVFGVTGWWFGFTWDQQLWKEMSMVWVVYTMNTYNYSNIM